jgi:hypothetical protein
MRFRDLAFAAVLSLLLWAGIMWILWQIMGPLL